MLGLFLLGEGSKLTESLAAVRKVGGSKYFVSE
jgi:hypothetical protein